MGLALSTRAAPDLALSALATACLSRGLEGIELDLGEAESWKAGLVGIANTEAKLVSLRFSSLEPEHALELASASASLRLPVSVPADAIAIASLSPIARAFQAQGGKLLLEVGTDLDRMLTMLGAIHLADCGQALGVAWEVRPSTERLDDASAVLFACRELLGLVRLYGGGPEQREQDGRGLGTLMTDLALSRYAGPIVLCPSRSETLPRWAKWLVSTKSAGCGTAAEARRIELDMREVEPRDRLETILSAYDSLARGATMRLTVDHEPSCMQYVLQDREAEGSFSFRKTDDGPEVWRAEVTKL